MFDSTITLIDTDDLVDSVLKDMGLTTASAHCFPICVRHEFCDRLADLLRKNSFALDFSEATSKRYGVLLFGNAFSISECYAEWLWDDSWSQPCVSFTTPILEKYVQTHPDTHFYKKVSFSVVPTVPDTFYSDNANRVINLIPDNLGNFLFVDALQP